MSLSAIKDSVIEFSQSFFKQEPVISSIKPIDNKWIVEIEIIVHNEYMRQRAKKPLIETYKLELDKSISVVSFERIRMRELGSIEETEDI
ncbi:MAG: hypothetical protein HPY66_1217 [Firmicutes bacterium]|nr:hypothetical protein [Bacillota bacterium]MDI6704981.1 gas vesicle protein GvpO [Bacillota bacterium]